MEILAPAGSWEALTRAEAAGADAVYLGYSAFSARAGAGNFDEEGLREALRFCHLHHMRVYVTVNTLVKDSELSEVKELLRLLRDLRVDGVLVQDLGVLRMAGKLFPELRIHASTQMAIHHATGVRWCARMGMKRVVLARECSLEEIRRCAQTGIEIEVFGHGAQCVSVSGECLFSSMVGERSGNRGRCAQPCRKRYRLEGKEGAWLSPRDLCMRDQLPELEKTGAASLKIEGRLKKPEYVYTVTESYRRGVDAMKEGKFSPASAAELEKLKQVFHRGGFMTGYAFGAEDAGVIDPAGVNHQGIRVGMIHDCRGNLARARMERDLHDGDLLRIRHGERSGEMIYAGANVQAGEIATLRLRQGLRAEKGDEIWRLTDAKMQVEALAAPTRSIPVEMEMEAWPGKEIVLRLSDGQSKVQVRGEIVSAARTRETSAEEIERQLRKTGGTDFEVESVKVLSAGAFVPVSMLNELRRKGLERLAEERINAFCDALSKQESDPVRQEIQRGMEKIEKTDDSSQGSKNAGASHPKAQELPSRMITVRTKEQADACRSGGGLIIWYPEDFRTDSLEDLMASMLPGDWLRLPEVCEENTLQEIYDLIHRHLDKLGGVLLGSVGQLGLSWPLPIAAGPGIPVMNREAAKLLGEQGCTFVMASPELTGEELRELLEQEEPEDGNRPRIVVQVYGRTQLMLLHHCPARTAQGWSQGHAACRLCEEGDPRALRGKTLEDERGYRFPLQRICLPEGCLVRLLNTLPTDWGDKMIPAIPAAEMTMETGEEAKEILDYLRRHEKSPGQSTRGHWNRPVL